MRNRFTNRIRSLLIIGVVCLGFSAAILGDVRLPGLDAAERWSRDLRFRIRGPVAPPGAVAILAIDDRSIQAIGRWPWPRVVLARAVAILASGGARSIGLDVLLPEPETAPEMGRIQGLMMAFTQLGLLTEDAASQAFFEEMADALRTADNDGLLAGAMAEAGNALLPMALIHGPPAPAGPEVAAILKRSRYRGGGGRGGGDVSPPFFYRALTPIPELAAAAAGLGYVNVTPDPDGAVRRFHLVMEYRGAEGAALMVPFPLRAAQIHLGLPDSAAGLDPPAGARLGDRLIPMDADGAFALNYYGPVGAIATYSLLDLLTGAVAPETFAGKTALIGAAAAGLGDHWPSPFSSFYWGVETHATAVENLLAGHWLRRPEWLRFADAMLLAGLGLALLPLALLPVSLGLLYWLALMLSHVMISQYLFARHGLLTLWVHPLAALILIGAAIFFLRYFTEGREKRILRGAFEQYLSANVVERVLRHPENLALGGEKKQISVLFSDIRDFTAMSENLSPERLVWFINRYLSAMTDVVLENGGTLDKYIGDAIMAIYGAPEDQPDHARRACRTAIRMMERLHEERDKWAEQGLPLVRVGIGINTGPMVVGNMGSERRFDYTVMGDHVNLGSRLEGLTKTYGVKIVVSEYTREEAGDGFLYRELDAVKVVGRMGAARIFELLTGHFAQPGRSEFAGVFEEALALYRKGDFAGARKGFETVLRLKPEDNPSRHFIERCGHYIQYPPADGWDGVSVLTRK